jgi:hypothetical protein
MESLTSWGYIAPPTVEKLDRVQQFYEDNVHAKKETLTPILARKLVALLINLSGESDPRTSSLLSGRQPSALARRALEVFAFFLKADSEFVDAVERLEGNELLSQLKLAQHLSARHFRMIDLTPEVVGRRWLTVWPHVIVVRRWQSIKRRHSLWCMQCHHDFRGSRSSWRR